MATSTSVHFADNLLSKGTGLSRAPNENLWLEISDNFNKGCRIVTFSVGRVGRKGDLANSEVFLTLDEKAISIDKPNVLSGVFLRQALGQHVISKLLSNANTS